MPDALVTKPFKAHLVLDGVERRLEAGERIAAAELAQWGRKADALLRTGRITLVTEVVAADASLEALVNTLVARASELGSEAVAKLEQMLNNLLANTSEPDLLAEVGDRGLSPAAEAEGDGASVAGGDPGGDAPSSAAPSPSADAPSIGEADPEAATEPEPGADTGEPASAEESTEPASDADEANAATEPEPGADTGEPPASEEA